MDSCVHAQVSLYGENGISYYERSRGRETVISSGFINLPIDFMPKKFQTHSLMHNGRMLDLVPPHNTPPRYVPIFFKFLNFFCDWDVGTLWIRRRLARQPIKNEQIMEKWQSGPKNIKIVPKLWIFPKIGTFWCRNISSSYSRIMKIGVANVNNGFLTYARVQVLQRVTSLYICTRSRLKIGPCVHAHIAAIWGKRNKLLWKI